MTPGPIGALSGSVVALAGGVGAARLLRGLVRAVPPESLTVIVNTGDDREFYGVHVSPDVDIVLYSLAGVVHETRGFGLAGDSFHIVDRLAELGHETWFRLGDRDFAQCLHRTVALQAGRSLSDITDELRRSLNLTPRILPMSDDPCPTHVELSDGRVLHFEEYLVRERSPDNVKSVDLGADHGARPAPGLLEALAQAETVILCPSNPVVSIGPILALPGVRDALAKNRAAVVAVSPLIGGAPVKGPADRLLRGTGHEVSARGVADLYRDFLDGIIIDDRDRKLAASIEATGIRTTVMDTLMQTPEIAAEISREALRLATAIRNAAS